MRRPVMKKVGLSGAHLVLKRPNEIREAAYKRYKASMGSLVAEAQTEREGCLERVRKGNE